MRPLRECEQERCPTRPLVKDRAARPASVSRPPPHIQASLASRSAVGDIHAVAIGLAGALEARPWREPPDPVYRAREAQLI